MVCMDAWVQHEYIQLPQVSGQLHLLPGLWALQVLACDKPGCIDAFFVDAVQSCGGEESVKQHSRTWPRQTASGFCRAVGHRCGFSPLDWSWLRSAAACGPWAQPPSCPHLLQSFSEPGGSETSRGNQTRVPFVSD